MIIRQQQLLIERSKSIITWHDINTKTKRCSYHNI